MMKKNLINPLKALALFTVVFGLLLVTGCGDDDGSVPTQTIYEIISTDTELSSLKDLIDEIELDTQLKSDGEYTLFAPSNEALIKLLNTLGLSNFDPVAGDIKAAVVSYHLSISGKYSIGDLPSTISTIVPNETIKVTDDDKLATGASVDASIERSIEATNGYVHIIDEVLVPEAIGSVIVQTLGTAAQPLLLSSAYSNLAAAIQKADAGKAPEETIVGALIALSDTEASGVTVFAPLNEVQGNPVFTAELVSSTSAEALDAMIRKHIVVTNLSTLADGEYPTLAGGTLEISADNNTAGGVPVITASGTVTTDWSVYPIAGVIQ